MNIKEKEVQAKDIGKIFNKIIAENFPNLEKEIFILVQKTSTTLNRHNYNRNFLHYVIVKTLSIENKEY
jgi:hypothetical protein